MSVKRVRDPLGIEDARLLVSLEDRDGPEEMAAMKECFDEGDIQPRIERFVSKRERLKNDAELRWFDVTIATLSRRFSESGETPGLDRDMQNAEAELIRLLMRSMIRARAPGVIGAKGNGVARPRRKTPLTIALEWITGEHRGWDSGQIIDSFRKVDEMNDEFSRRKIAFNYESVETKDIGGQDRVSAIICCNDSGEISMRVTRQKLSQQISRIRNKPSR